MKKNLALLLTSAFLLFALTGCGGDNKNDANPGNDTPAENGTGDNGTAQPGGNDAIAPGDNGNQAGGGTGDPAPGGDDGLNGAGDDMTGATDGGGTDPVTKQSGRIGVPYGQMLENGRVHDADGILRNRSSGATLGASY